MKVIGAATDGRNSEEKVRRFARELGINLPIWLGANASDLGAFGLEPMLPGTVIVDRDGKVAWSTQDMVTIDDLKARIDAALGSAATR